MKAADQTDINIDAIDMKYIITESRLEKLVDTYLTEYLLKDVKEENVTKYPDLRYWRDKGGTLIAKYRKNKNELFIDYHTLYDLSNMFNIPSYEAGKYIAKWIDNKFEFPGILGYITIDYI